MHTYRRDPELQVESEILRCFKALLNNTVSITFMVWRFDLLIQ